MAFKISMQAATATPRRRAGLRVAGGIVAAVAIFGMAGYFGGPPLLKSVVAKQLGEAIGRKVTFGGAEVRPFTLGTTISDITIYETDGTTPMVKVGSAEIDASIASVWHRAPVVDTLHVDRFSVHLVRSADGRMNFDDIQQRIAAKPAKPGAEPARFSVNNIALTDSSVMFDDKQLAQTQRVDHLTITLPFLSNLPHDVDIFTQPWISAQVNGTPVAITGNMLPFANSREAHLNVNLDGLEVAQYMPFAPRLTDAVVKDGKLDTRLSVGFHQQKDHQEIFVGGTAALRDADVRKHDGAPLVRAGRIAVDIDRIDPLAKKVHLRSLAVDGLAVQALRRADGSLDLTTALLPAPTPGASKAPAAPASGAAATPPAKTDKEAPWSYAIDQIAFRQGRLALRDEAAPSGPGTLALGPLDVTVNGLSGDSDKAAKLEATLTVADGQTIRHEGTLSLRARTLAGTLKAHGVRPQGFAAWWPRELQAQLTDTTLNADLRYRMSWAQPIFELALDKSRVELAPLTVTLRQPVAMPTGAASAEPLDKERQARRERRAKARGDLVGSNLPLMHTDKLVLDGLVFDLAKRTLQADALELSKPQLSITRDYRGQGLELARIWATQSQAATRAGASTPPQPKAARNGLKTPSQPGLQPAPQKAAAPAPWKVQLARLALADGNVRMIDYQPALANGNRPVIHQYRNVDLTTGAVGWPLAAAAVPMKLRAETGRRGVIGIDGSVLPATPATQLELDLNEVELAPLQPYLADRFNAAVRGGTVSVKGTLGVTAPPGRPVAATFAGNARLGNVRAVDRVSGDDFLRWRTLALSGIDFSMDDSKGPLRLGLGNIALSDFYARVILNANGRLNLQDITAGGAQKGQAAPTTSLTQANPAGAGAPAAPAVQPAPAGGKPQIRIGGVKVNKGNINFSDFFVKPNYSANLTGMQGAISKVSTGDPTPADLALEGRLDDDAPVSISGKLNPLGEQLYLDIAAKAAGVELTRLTPYATKYAGYPITKGKLTVDVSYKIENGKLDAKNHLFLDQLTFGDRVDSPSATKLPVLLAVSLLKDRNGVIDVNLPVSGSLSDPQFSIGGVIGRVIVNLLTRAITSPFSLIASAFGGSGEELGYVEFPAGTDTLTDAARQKVATLAKALNDRPALRLEISGRIDPASDADGARRAWLTSQVAEQKARDQRQSAHTSTSDDDGSEQGAQVAVSPQEYPKYLEAVYKRASFKKPRNIVGFAKSLPTAEMEKLLLDNAPVTEAGLRALAEQRALAVKQALERDGKVPDARLFLTAPKLSAEGIKDKGAPNRVDFAVRQ